MIRILKLIIYHRRIIYHYPKYRYLNQKMDSHIEDQLGILRSTVTVARIDYGISQNRTGQIKLKIKQWNTFPFTL